MFNLGVNSKFFLGASRENISFKVFLLSTGMFNLGVNSKIFLRASRENISFKLFLLSFIMVFLEFVNWMGVRYSEVDIVSGSIAPFRSSRRRKNEKPGAGGGEKC